MLDLLDLLSQGGGLYSREVKISKGENFEMPPFEDLLARLIVVLLGIPIHEWAHGYAAYLMGDTTPEREGRLSLNPLTHLDPIGTIMILLTGFGWGRAARVNPYQMRKVPNPRTAMALSALAGPASNVVQMIFFLILRYAIIALWGLNTPTMVIVIINLIIWTNMGLALFNMLPIPPLDGSRVLAGVASHRVADFIERLEPMAPYILIAVLFILPRFGIDLISMLISPIMRFFASLLGLWV